MGKKKWLPEDWHCNKCDFKIFGTKDKCKKCGLLRSQWCCKKCHYVADKYKTRCPNCGNFNYLDDQYSWIREQKDEKMLEKFIELHPEYRPCSACASRSYRPNIPLVHCYKHG